MVTHRDSAFLRPAIASVLGQTWRELELVLVDNGTGLSAAAIGDLGSDPRLRWVRLPRNAGIAAGHNAGVAAAHGECIALLDHDDIALPQRLERQMALLQAEPELVLVSSLAEGVDESGRVLGREFALLGHEAHLSYSQYAAPFYTPACLGPRATFAGHPYRGEFAVGADFDFVTRVIEAGPTAVVPEVLLHYRHHPAQATVAHAHRVAAERAEVRLLTARRRAGRAERLEGFQDMPDAAGRALTEGFPVLAAYQARRSVAEVRTAGAAARAGRVFLRALRSAAAHERALVARMFLTGPVRALGLHPA
jgi:GT2 family glycosyltransferase